MTNGKQKRDDDIALAGEFVLGGLTAKDRLAVQKRQLRDPEFAAAIADWENRFAPLADDVRSQTPPARVWAKIEQAAFADAATPGLWNAVSLWRWLSAGFAAAAAASLVALAVLSPPAPAPLVASLQATGAAPAFLASLDPASGQLVIRAATAPADRERVRELWLIPGDGVPRSLGVMAARGATRIEIPASLLAIAAADTALAISLEPAGGSPTGKPTGPVIALGKLQQI